MKYYANYPADPNTLRATAAAARKSGKDVHDVSDLVATRHKHAVSATDGELVAPVASTGTVVSGDAAQVSQAAIWAGLQIERFCDAIEVYNTHSVDPMSIARLNERVAEIVEAGGVVKADCLPAGGSQLTGQQQLGPVIDPAPVLDPVVDPDVAEQQRLNREQQRLIANLDDAAKKIARAIEKGPTDRAILRAWRAGNLPAYARYAWPDLNLENVPITGVDDALVDIDADDVRDLLDDASDPLTDAELEWLWLNFPQEMQRFADDWKLDDHIGPAGWSPEGMEDVDAPHGWIQGPDGRWYPVQVPFADAGTTHSVNSDGWTTVYHHLTDVEAGEELAVLLPLGPPKVIGPRAVQGDQGDYWTTDANGDLVYLGGGDPPTNALEPPPSGPYPESAVEAGEAPKEIGPNPRLERFQRAGNALDLAITAGENILYNQQLAANNNYAASVVFQETPDGDVRVVIELGQALVDEEGDGSSKYLYGVITENGEYNTAPPSG